jgi:tryptophan halogenase
MGNGHVYSSAFISDDEAEKVLVENLEGELLADPRRLSFTTGMRKQSWNRNVIALGLSSGFVEPLESTSIHLIQAGIARLLELFPDKRFNPIERDEYNRRLKQGYEWVRDFIILHYKATERDDSEFWKHCAKIEIPDKLQEKIDQFRNKGRVLIEGVELFNITSWVAVMLGQNIIPDDYSPVIDGLDEDKVAAALEQLRRACFDLAQQLPSQKDFIASCCSAMPPSAAREFAL